jgi:hypothetical protein
MDVLNKMPWPQNVHFLQESVIEITVWVNAKNTAAQSFTYSLHSKR